MSVKTRHWEMALSELEEWRLARDEFRAQRSAASPGPDEDVDRPTSVIKSRFRRWQPAKAPVQAHDMVFVNQSALEFGENIAAPVTRRRFLVLRMDEASGELLGAPVWAADAMNLQGRFLPFSAESEGIEWCRNSRPLDCNLYDSVEYVARADLRLSDADWQVAHFYEPLIGKVLRFVFMPVVATQN